MRYSRESFEGYRYRIKVEIHYLEFEKGKALNKDTNFDIYTTETSKDNMLKWLISKKNNSVMGVGIIHMASREQDEMADKMISEMLSEW